MASTSLVIGGVFAILAFVLNFISFVSPYWLVSDERANNQFQRIGLWEACLQDFVDPKDYVSKLYNGCWWIFWPEYAEIRYWLNPGWFIALQVVAAFNFMAMIYGTIVVVGVLCHCCSGEGCCSFASGIIAIAISFLFSGIDAILFGLGSIDRTWMPKSDFNTLSWGYWLHVLGGFFAFISAVSLFCYWYHRDEEYDQEEKKHRY